MAGSGDAHLQKIPGQGEPSSVPVSINLACSKFETLSVPCGMRGHSRPANERLSIPGLFFRWWIRNRSRTKPKQIEAERIRTKTNDKSNYDEFYFPWNTTLSQTDQNKSLTTLRGFLFHSLDPHGGLCLPVSPECQRKRRAYGIGGQDKRLENHKTISLKLLLYNRILEVDVISQIVLSPNSR